MDIQAALEAEKRGILPPGKKQILDELRNRGAIEGGAPQDTQTPEKWVTLDDVGNTLGSAALGMGKSLPFNTFDRAAAGVGASLIDPFLHVKRQIEGIEPMMGPSQVIPTLVNDYEDRKRRLQGYESDIKNESPKSYLAGMLAGNIAQSLGGYKAAMGGLKNVIPAMNNPSFLGSLLRIGGGAASNVGVGQAMNLGQTGKFAPEQIPSEAAWGGGGEALNELMSPPARKLGGKMIDVALGRPSKFLESEMGQGSTLGEDLYDRGVFGISSSLAKQADQGMETAGQKLNTLLTNAPGEVNYENSIDELNSLKKALPSVGSEREAAAIQDRIDLLQEHLGSGENALTPAQANAEKVALYKKVGNNAYLQDNPALGKSIDQAQARGLMKSIEEVAPDVKGVNKDYSVYRRLSDAMDKLGAKDQSRIASILRYGGLPAAAGAFGGYEAGKEGAIGGTLGSLAMMTPGGLTTTAAGMKTLVNLLSQIGPLYTGIKQTATTSSGQ